MIAVVIELAILGILARYLGVSAFGTYVFVLAIVRAFQDVGDLGLRSVLLRDIAADPRNAAKALGVARSLAWLLSVAMCAVIAGAVNLLRVEPEVVRLTYLASLALVATLQANAYAAVCRAFEAMEFNAIGHVLERVVYGLLVVRVVQMDWGLQGVFGSLLAANLLLWLFYYVVVRVRYVRPRLSFDVTAWWAMAREAIPVGVGVVLRRMAWRVDTVLLVKMADSAAAGLFNAAYRIPAQVNQLSVTLSHPVAPVYSRLAKGPAVGVSGAWEKSFKLFWVGSVPMAVVALVYADIVIGLLFGAKFAAAADALRVQSVAIMFLFPTGLYLGLFTAVGQQRLYMIISAACLAVNTVFDLLLIPGYGFIGASIATSLAEITFFAVGAYFIRMLGISLSFLRLMARPVLAGLLMGGLLYPLAKAPLWWALLAGLPAGMLLYGCVLLLLGTFSREELALMRKSLPFGGARLQPGTEGEGGEGSH